MTWPTNLLDPAYAAQILSAVTQSEYDLVWTPLLATQGGHTIELLFCAKPLRISGVFVNVSAALQQQIADALGALLPTPKVMDLAWLARSATIAPAITVVASTSEAMQRMSAKLDAEIAAVGSPDGIVVCQKTWCLGNSLLAHPGRAMNLGYYVIPNQPGNMWDGIATEACVSFPTQPQKGRTIQGPGWAHDPSHLDDSQCGWFMHRACRVDGVDRDLADVLQDPALAPLISHEGPLKILRQPGVPVFACAVSGSQVAAKSPGGLCPTPASPVVAASGGIDWGTVALTAGAAVVVVGLFALAIRGAGRAARR